MLELLLARAFIHDSCSVIHEFIFVKSLPNQSCLGKDGEVGMHRMSHSLIRLFARAFALLC